MLIISAFAISYSSSFARHWSFFDMPSSSSTGRPELSFPLPKLRRTCRPGHTFSPRVLAPQANNSTGLADVHTVHSNEALRRLTEHSLKVMESDKAAGPPATSIASTSRHEVDDDEGSDGSETD